jgi:arsenite methyltransferase
MVADPEGVHGKVRERYSLAVVQGRSCHTDECCAINYSPAEMARIPVAANLGLGSGHPVRYANLRLGETVVDLGSGAGVDVFLAASLVGQDGRAIGVDMTPAMIERARTLAESQHVDNASFFLGPIERLSLPDAMADVALSNCVINLSPDKTAVFAEAFRILKPGGRLVISDVVQEWELGPIEDDCGCVGTAMVRAEYLKTIREAGFTGLQIAEDRPWRVGLRGIEASALTLTAKKPEQEVTS